MITNNQHQAAWVAYLKTIPSTITPVIVAEVREDNWKGTDFVYPNIRVRAERIIPNPDSKCGLDTAYITILVFTEDKSSQNSDVIAGAIANYFHGKDFTSNGIKIVASVETLVAAAPADEMEVVWRSEVQLKTLLS